MNNKIYIRGLGAIRGIAASLIVYFHVWALCGFSGFSHYLDSIVSNFDSLVRMFFMLSAFALLCGYESTLLSNEKNITNFYIKRYFRLAPVFYTALIFKILFDYFSDGLVYPLISIIVSLIMLGGTLPVNQELIVWASWAVEIEWLFYLWFPIFIMLVKRRWLFILSVICSIFITYNYKMLLGKGGVANEHINILIYCSYFFVGAILYKLVPKIQNLRKNNIWNLIQYIYIIFSIILGVVLDRIINRDIGMLVMFALIIAGSIYGYTKVIDNKIFNLLGKISYAIYLYHMIIIQVLSELGIIQFITNNIFNKFISYLVVGTLVLFITSIIGWLATIYVEEWWVEKSKKFLIK